MSRNFQTYSHRAYSGNLFSSPISLGPDRTFKACPIMINWANYGAGTAQPNTLVSVDFNNAAYAAKFDRIRSVFIDNSNSNFPVSVIFPDTGFVVNAQPDSAAFYPVMSNSLACQVAITGVRDGAVPSCVVIFTDAVLNAYSDIEVQQVQEILANSSNSSFQKCAGELYTMSLLPNFAGAAKPFAGAGYTGGFINIVAMSCTVSGLKNASGSDNQVRLLFSDTNLGGKIFMDVQPIIPNGIAANFINTVFSVSNVNISIPASHFDFLIFAGSNIGGFSVSGTSQLHINYTYTLY